MVPNFAEILLRLISVGIWCGAGLGGYTFVFNRWLLRLRDSSYKHPVMGSVFLAFILIPAALGGLTPWWCWIFPGIAYSILILDQVRNRRIRFRLKGLPPVEVDRNGFSLSPAALPAVTTTDLHRVRYAIPLSVPDFSGESSLTVAHLTDFHITEKIPISYYTGVFEWALAESPDLIFLTGDYITQRRHQPLLQRALEPLEGCSNGYAILGNHDYWLGAEFVAPVLRKAGLHLLSGSPPVSFSPWFRIMGSEEPWGPAARIDPALSSGLDLILTHTPDNIDHFLYKTPSLHPKRARAVFCGHLHAGQICLPGILPGAQPLSIFMPSNYGRRFDRRPGLDGHFVFPEEVHLFVSGGVGTGTPPVRLYCPPDFFIVRFDFIGKGSGKAASACPERSEWANPKRSEGLDEGACAELGEPLAIHKESLLGAER